MSMDINDFGQVLKDQGIEQGSGVPCSYFKPLVNYMGADDGLDYLPAASEGEAVAIAAGMVAAGKPAFALMQNSGLGNAVNPITSLLYTYQIPIVLLVSHRGQPDGQPDEPQHKRMGEITQELVTLSGIECNVLDSAKFAKRLKDVQTRGVPAGWVCQKGVLTGGPAAPVIKFEAHTGAVEMPARKSVAPELTREQALSAILPILNGTGGTGTARPAVVATTGKLSRELYELDDREHDKSNRFYMVGSMGCAAGFGLGIARAHPSKVVVLDGDGALLMKFGSLATVGMSGAKNFHHVVFDNGAHDSTGGQPTASPWIDTATIALACGYKMADTVSSPADIEAALTRQVNSDGPTLLRVIIKTGARKDLGRPKLKPLDAYKRFSGWLASE